MAGPLDAIASLNQAQALYAQHLSAQREAEISDDRRRRAAERARRRELSTVTFDNPVEGRVIEEEMPGHSVPPRSTQVQRHASGVPAQDPGRIDVLI